jgi:hypothetical protein
MHARWRLPGGILDPQSPARTNRLMEEVCERENMRQALRRVKAKNLVGERVTATWAEKRAHPSAGRSRGSGW